MHKTNGSFQVKHYVRVPCCIQILCYKIGCVCLEFCFFMILLIEEKTNIIFS